MTLHTPVTSPTPARWIPARDPDLRLRVRVEGAGPPVLLLHGLAEDLDVWWERGWVDRLARSRRVIAFDARGHGGSSKPHDPARYDEGARVADAIAVLDAAGAARADVVGYSMGGRTALALAADARDRVRAVIAGGAPAFGQPMEPLRRLIAAGLAAMRAAVERQCGPLPDRLARRLLDNDAAALAAVVAHDRPSLVDALAAGGVRGACYAAERDPLRPAIEAGARALGWPCAVISGYDHFDLAVAGGGLDAVEDALARAATG